MVFDVIACSSCVDLIAAVGSRIAANSGDAPVYEADVGLAGLRAGTIDDTRIWEDSVHVLGYLLVPSGRNPISKFESAGVQRWRYCGRLDSLGLMRPKNSGGSSSLQ